MTRIPLSDATERLPELVRRASTHQERFAVTVAGRPVAVLLSADYLERLEETSQFSLTRT